MSLTEFDSNLYKLGKLCKHGHNWDSTGQTLRYAKHRHDCVECRKDVHSKRKLAGKVEAYQSAYYQANKDKIIKRVNEWTKNNPERTKARYKDWRYSEKGKLRNKMYQQKSRALKRKHGHAVRLTDVELKTVYEFFENQCAYCGCKENTTVDHYIALNKGGHHILSNLVLACHSCNSSKRDKPPETWYRNRSYFCQERWNKVQSYVNATFPTVIQLKLFD